MAFLSWIVIGAIAGWVATEFFGSHRHNLLAGLSGGVVGGMILTKYSGAVTHGFFGSLLGAAVGAAIFLAVWRAIKRT